MTTVTNITPGATGTADLEPLVKQLARRADANRDGQVSTAEFAQFLTDQLTHAVASNPPPPAETIHSAPTETPATPLLNAIGSADMKEIDDSAQTANYRAMRLANALIAQMRVVK